MFARVKVTGKYRYLQLVENRRVSKRIVQRVLCTLGRVEDLQRGGNLDALVRSLERFGQPSELGEEAVSGNGSSAKKVKGRPPAWIHACAGMTDSAQGPAPIGITPPRAPQVPADAKHGKSPLIPLDKGDKTGLLDHAEWGSRISDEFPAKYGKSPLIPLDKGDKTNGLAAKHGRSPLIPLDKGDRREPATSLDKGDKLDERTAILSRSPILSGLPAEYLAELSRVAKERSLKRGQFLFFQDDPVDSWYVVDSGVIKFIRHCPSGKDVVATVYGPGETLPNIILFVGQPQICSGQAVTDARVLEVKRDDLIAFLYGHLELGFEILVRMLGVAGKRFSDATVLLSELSAERTDYRLARILVTLSLEFGNTIPLTQREVAEMAGTTTETATRFLSRLRRAGVARSYRGTVEVLEREKLGLLAEMPLMV